MPNLVKKLRRSKGSTRFAGAALGMALGLTTVLTGSYCLDAAGQAAPAAASRVVGTITSVGTGLLTVKTDAGVERKVTVPDGIKLQRIAPGERDLSKAATIQFSDLAVGDRVLVRLAPEPTSDPVSAIGIIAIPQADLAQKQQKDREEWQRNGVGGLVKSVDPGTGVIVITSGAGPMQKTITLHTTPTTELRRYAADSVSFDAAKAAPLEVIKPGDQLRARGTKNADGTEMAAEAVVSGSFRNISGTIASINPSNMTVTLKDLATKQMVNVHIGPEAQMRKLPEDMAKRLASATKPADGVGPGDKAAAGGAGNAAAPVGMAGAGAPAGAGNASPGGTADGQARHAHGANSEVGGAPGAGGGDAAGGRRGGGDPQQILARAPVIHLSDLQKGDAVMLVSTEGTNDVSAITLLAGVEPLLQAPASTQNMLLSGWNMSSGSAEAAQ